MGEIHRKKIRIAQRILREHEIPLWLIYSASGKDPTMSMLGNSGSIASALLLSPTKKRLVVSKLDVDNIGEEYRSAEKIVTKGVNERYDAVTRALKEMGFAGKVAVNYSRINPVSRTNSEECDLLGSGARDWIDNLVGKEFQDLVKGKKIRSVVCSAEDAVCALYDRKSSFEIEKMRIVSRWTHEILEDTFDRLKPGMTDKDAYDLVHKITNDSIPHYVRKAGYVRHDLAWGARHCPIVITGDTWVKSDHSDPTGEVIAEGNTVCFDYGLKVHFDDQTQWHSDIQRTGYVLRKSEDSAPDEIQKRFDVVYEAISKGIEKMRPGTKGHAIDEAVRNHITSHGYPGYGTATGHPIGSGSHDPGTILRQGSERVIQPNGTYAIEPKIGGIANGVSLEEGALVNPKGSNETLCPRQEKLYLIK